MLVKEDIFFKFYLMLCQITLAEVLTSKRQGLNDEERSREREKARSLAE